MSSQSTILITGCSSGFGLDIARHFLEKGWRVIATMRTPKNDLLPESGSLRILALDVTDPESIRRCFEEAGPVDALVNNAGIGLIGPLEGEKFSSVRQIFETNTFATMAMTQAVLPQFRARRSGVIVNVTSSVTLKSLPLLSVYTASKAAVNAFTESLALELSPFNIHVRLVLPGRAPGTRFGANARHLIADTLPEAYEEFRNRVFSAVQDTSTPVTYSQDVADAVWTAVTDPDAPMRIPAGADAVALS